MYRPQFLFGTVTHKVSDQIDAHYFISVKFYYFLLFLAEVFSPLNRMLYQRFFAMWQRTSEKKDEES